jgi:hypothetical protein
MASGVNTAELDWFEGPRVRIRLPPAESPRLALTRALRVENRGFRAGMVDRDGKYLGFFHPVRISRK